ncbi:MAG TPA: beta-ketoacyl synthase N-terminal-like domain-containing protein [Thermoanaerobaculia bacterium]|nr:beta-ketoacyl synthase N-terminal-like domain-containing protein [Thermoanaerobaculia bacterium]
MSPSIVVTGLGTFGAYGGGAADLRRALESSEPPWSLLAEIDNSAGFHLSRAACRAFLVDPALLREWLSPAEARRMSPPSKLAVAAARMALRDGGLDGSLPDEQAGVAIATAFGPASYSEGLLRQILLEGPEAASPLLFTESVANAPAAQIAILTRARGPSVTICQREAGALLAVAQGAADIAAGRVPVSLAGTVDEMTPLLHSLLDRFGTLARNGGPGGMAIARPLDRRRSGFLAAEGATMLLLEEEENARRRGATPVARIVAWGSAFDPTAPAAGWGTGHESLARVLRRSLERSGVPLASIDRIVVGASGSRGGDRLEARMVRDAWGEVVLPPVLAPKSVTGEYGGGFLAATVLAAAGASFGPAAGFEESDPELGVVPHDGSRLAPPSTVLVTSVAVGGAASWLVLGAP